MKLILKRIVIFTMMLFFEEKIIKGYQRFRLRWYNPLNYPFLIIWWIGTIIYLGIKEVDFDNPFKFS